MVRSGNSNCICFPFFFVGYLLGICDRKDCTLDTISSMELNSTLLCSLSHIEFLLSYLAVLFEKEDSPVPILFCKSLVNVNTSIN